MALTKTISASQRGFTLSFILMQTPQIETNTSEILWELRLTCNSTTYAFDGYGIGWSAYIGSAQVAYHNRYTSDRYTLLHAGDYITLQSGTYTVNHNADGALTINVSASMTMASSPYGAGDINISASPWTLDTIPRASSMTWTTLNIGSSVTFAITRASNSFTHKLTYTYDGSTGIIGTNLGTSATWTIPSSWLTSLPNSVQGAGSFTLTTYNGTTEIGSVTYNVAFLVPTNIKPAISSFSVTPYNSNAWLASRNLWVSGFTQADVSISATAGTGSTMSSYAVTGDITGNAASFRSDILSSGVKNLIATVADKRGRTATASQSITVQQYSQPAVTQQTAVRGTYSGGTWTDAEDGTDIKVTATAVVSLSENACAIHITCNGEEKIINGTTGTVYFLDTSNEQVYDVNLWAVDSLGSVGATSTIKVGTADVSFSWQYDRIGIGKVAQKAKHFEVSYRLSAEGDIDVGGITLPDEEEAGYFIKMKPDGSGLEWGGQNVAGGEFRADYNPDTSEITLWADFATPVEFDYNELTSILSIGTDSESEFLDKVYPVGSIYMSVNSTNPGTLFGGTWEQIQDTFLLAAGSTYAAGSTGGEAKHTLTTAEMPAHSHVVTRATTSYASGQQSSWRALSWSGTNHDYNDVVSSESSGSGNAHNNMPPYLSVYVFKRVS